jgi:hypothetical protein
MTCQTEDLTIKQGKTFVRVVRWETAPFVYKPITAISRAAPVQITATGHGMPDGWRGAVVSAGGMRKINAKNWPLRDTDFHTITSVDPNNVQFNDVVSLDYTAYTSGGSLVYYTPVDLDLFVARMQIRDTVEDTTILMSLVTGTERITIDNTAKTITLLISAADTAGITWLQGVYDLELESPSGVVTQLLKGNITVEDEVTR